MRAVIFDVDGTLCDVRPVRHYVNGPARNFDKFHRASLFCDPVPEVLGLWNAIRPGVTRLVVTARDARYNRPTRDWLTKHNIHPTKLYMRPWGDQRPDYEVKRDILGNIRIDGFEPVLAVDDNPSVIRLWEDNDIPTVVVPGWDEQ